MPDFIAEMAANFAKAQSLLALANRCEAEAPSPVLDMAIAAALVLPNAINATSTMVGARRVGPNVLQQVAPSAVSTTITMGDPRERLSYRNVTLPSVDAVNWQPRLICAAAIRARAAALL